MADRFLYFDLGNVLLNFDHRLACRQMAEVSGVDPERVWQFVFETDLELRYEAGEITTDQFYETFCRETGTRPDRAALIDAAAAIFELNLSIVPLVTQLAAAGHRMGVLSNTNEIHWEYCTARGQGPGTRGQADSGLRRTGELVQSIQAGDHGNKLESSGPNLSASIALSRFALLTDCFEVFALSFQLKSCKPAPEIYRAAAELAGVSPRDVFYVDDREENVEGARAAGFDAVRYTGTSELARELRRRGVCCNY
jgi:FMN phosphatase YigB (HAD superfamily)